MYVKPQRRQMQGMYVPDNYHGTAFTETESEQDPALQKQPEESQHGTQDTPAPEAVPTAKKEDGGLLSSLFSGFGGLGSDDILLLVLIVLLWRSGGEDGRGTSEIVPLLALLLFMG